MATALPSYLFNITDLAGGLAMSRRKISTTVYITSKQNAKLKMLSERTNLPVAEYIRRGIDRILEENQEHIPVQLDLLGESGDEE